MFALFVGHLVLHFHLVAHVLHRSSSFFLLGQETVYQVSHPHFQLVLEVVLELTKDISELFTVFHSCEFNLSLVIQCSSLFGTHEREVLLKTH